MKLISNFNQIDLLRRRRNKIFLYEPYFIDTRKYIIRGIYTGVSVFALFLFAFLIVFIRTNLLNKEKNSLKQYAIDYDTLERKLNQEDRNYKQLVSFNNNLKASLMNIGSSSAFMKEISLITPNKIKIKDFSVNNNKLTINGQLFSKDSIKNINAYLIKLNQSEFIIYDDMDLSGIKADKKINHKSNPKPNISFKITTTLSTDYRKINETKLEELGSYGLASRLLLLRQIN